MHKFIKFSYFGLVYLFLYLPIFVLVVYSFNDATFSTMWHGFTWRWYTELFHDQTILLVTRNSLFVAILAATIASLMGMLGAVALFKYRFFGRKLLHGLVFVLIVAPDLVFGIALLVLYTALHFQLGFWTLLLAHITFCIPFVMVTVFGRLQDTNKHLFEAARDLGASESMVFWKIILPLMLPAVISGWLLSFALSMDDVIISFFVTGPSFQILPLYVYSMTHVGVTPEVNAVVTLLFAMSVVVGLIAYFMIRRRDAKMV